MTTSPEIDKLAAALSKAQGQIEGAEKDATNEFFSKGSKVSRYATLASVWDACRAALSANELSVVQMPGDCLIDGPGSRMKLTTRLMHSSGQWIEETMSIPIKEVGPHGAVGGITYARRAALAAFVGVAPADDDDGNEIQGAAASTVGGKSPVRTLPASPPTSKMDSLRAQEKAVLEQLVRAGLADVLVLKPGPEHTLAKESLRVKMQVAVADLGTIEGLEFWINELTRYRDKMDPAREIQV